jgi:hypothetical protein
MKLFSKVTTIAACFFVMSNHVHSIDLSDSTLEVYGKIHMALNYMDSGVEADEVDNDSGLSDGDVSLSSNSSRLGFKGEIATGVDNLVAFYQLEQTINLDGYDGDTFATRNSYLGLKEQQEGYTRWEIKAGYHDTLAKSVSAMAMLGDTAADRRAIMGAGATSGNKADKRVANMLLATYYLEQSGHQLAISAQYSTEATSSKGTVDDNDAGFAALGATWKQGNFVTAVAHDYWKNGTSANLHVTRVASRYQDGHWTALLLAENLRQSDDLNRKAWGGQLALQDGDFKWIGSVLVAESAKGYSASGATMTSLAVERSWSKVLKTYALYTRTANDANASYQGVDGGMNDELETTAGNTPQAVSAGVVLKF